MRNALLFFMVLTASNRALEELPQHMEDPEPSEEVEHWREGIEDLINGAKGLEFYLADKINFEEHTCDVKSCAIKTWEQPKLDEYKKDPKSYLPNDCKGSQE